MQSCSSGKVSLLPKGFWPERRKVKKLRKSLFKREKGRDLANKGRSPIPSKRKRRGESRSACQRDEILKCIGDALLLL